MSLSETIKRRLQEHEALAVGEAVAAAGIASYINVKKSNSNAGTYRIGAKTDGTGGVDADVVGGLALGLAGLAVDPMIGSHLVAVATGLLCGFSARQGAAMALKAATKQNTQQTSGQVGATVSQLQPNGHHQVGPGFARGWKDSQPRFAGQYR